MRTWWNAQNVGACSTQKRRVEGWRGPPLRTNFVVDLTVRFPGRHVLLAGPHGGSKMGSRSTTVKNFMVKIGKMGKSSRVEDSWRIRLWGPGLAGWLGCGALRVVVGLGGLVSSSSPMNNHFESYPAINKSTKPRGP